MANDGGPAFPYKTEDRLAAGGQFIRQYPGMTLRDWFAGQAIQGFSASSCEGPLAGYAAEAYRVADALLAERAKTHDG